MKTTSGAGMGWLFFSLFFMGAIFFSSIALNFLTAVIPDLRGVLQNMGGTVVAWGVFAIGILGAVIGNKMSRDDKNRPHRLKIEEYSGTISECVRKLPGLRARAEAWKQEMHRFAAWQAQRSSPPPLSS